MYPCYLLMMVFSPFSQNALPATAAAFGQGTGNILLDNVVCQGNESSILDCQTNPVGTNDCEHSEDVGVICQNSKGLSIKCLRIVHV